LDISENLGKAFDFTRRLLDDVGNLLMLIVFSIIPIVNLVVVGYLAKIVRENPGEPPKLKDYGRLFVDGLLVFLALMVYLIVPVLVIVAGITIAAGPQWFMRGFGAFSIVTLISGGFIIVAGLILLFAALFMGLIAVGNMIRTQSFSKIFAFSENWQLINKVGLVNYGLWLAAVVVLSILLFSIGNLIPWVGTAIAYAFYMPFLGKSMAMILDEALGTPTPAQPQPTPPAPSEGISI